MFGTLGVMQQLDQKLSKKKIGTENIEWFKREKKYF